MEFALLIVLNAIPAFIFLFYFIYSFKNLNNRLILNFSFMTLAISVFSLGKMGELLARSLDFAVSAVVIQYFGLSFLSVFLFNFAYKFRYNRYPSPAKIGYASIIPFVSLFLVITNNIHQLYFKKMELIPHENYFVLVSSKGIFYYIFLLNIYLTLVFSIGALCFAYKNNRCNFKEQSKLMLTGLVFPVVFSIPFLINPFRLNPVILGLLFMTYFSHKALFKYRFLDLKETIRELYFDKITEGIFVIDDGNRIIDFNREAAILLPFLNSRYLGRLINDYRLGKKIIESDKSDFFELEIEFKSSKKIYEFRKNPIIVNGKSIAYVYIVSDKTAIKNLVCNLSNLANKDFLTGIDNRMSFLKSADSELNRLKRYGGEFSLVMIDIDFFKKVNDTYGHIVGDEVLKSLTSLIKENLRATDIFGRLGGEEFCILLTETSVNNGKKICEKIRELVESTPIRVNNIKLSITISLGMTYYNNEMTPVPMELIIDLADKALYSSKRLGRNQIMYNHFPLRY